MSFPSTTPSFIHHHQQQQHQQQQLSSSVPSSTSYAMSMSMAQSASASSSSATASNTVVYRIQILPHKETGFNSTQIAGFNFTPIEKNIRPGTVIRIGRKVDKGNKDKKKDKDAPVAIGTSSPAAVAPVVSATQPQSFSAPNAPSPLANLASPPSQTGTLSASFSPSSNLTTMPPPSAISAPIPLPGDSILQPTQPSATFTAPIAYSTRSNDMATMLMSDEDLGAHSELQMSGGSAEATSPYANAMALSTSPPVARATSDFDVLSTSLPQDSFMMENQSPQQQQSEASDDTSRKSDFIAFRSKVVSRTHAELWVSNDGQVRYSVQPLEDVGELLCSLPSLVFCGYA
jgi:hypothetical protein